MNARAMNQLATLRSRERSSPVSSPSARQRARATTERATHAIGAAMPQLDDDRAADAEPEENHRSVYEGEQDRELIERRSHGGFKPAVARSRESTTTAVQLGSAGPARSTARSGRRAR